MDTGIARPIVELRPKAGWHPANDGPHSRPVSGGTVENNGIRVAGIEKVGDDVCPLLGQQVAHVASLAESPHVPGRGLNAYDPLSQRAKPGPSPRAVFPGYVKPRGRQGGARVDSQRLQPCRQSVGSQLRVCHGPSGSAVQPAVNPLRNHGPLMVDSDHLVNPPGGQIRSQPLAMAAQEPASRASAAPVRMAQNVHGLHERLVSEQRRTIGPRQQLQFGILGELSEEGFHDHQVADTGKRNGQPPYCPLPAWRGARHRVAHSGVPPCPPDRYTAGFNVGSLYSLNWRYTLSRLRPA